LSPSGAPVARRPSPVEGRDCQPCCQLGQGADDVGLDPLLGDLDGVPEGGGQGGAGPDGAAAAEQSQPLGVGPHPSAPQTHDRALGLGQDGQLLVGQLLPVQGCPPAQFAQRLQREAGGGDGRGRGRRDLGTKLDGTQDVHGPQDLHAGRCQVLDDGAEQVGRLVIVEHERSGRGSSSRRPSGGHTREPRRRDRSSAVSASPPKRATTASGAVHRSAALTDVRASGQNELQLGVGAVHGRAGGGPQGQPPVARGTADVRRIHARPPHRPDRSGAARPRKRRRSFGDAPC